MLVNGNPWDFTPKLVGVTTGLMLARQDGQLVAGHPAQPPATCLSAIRATWVEMTRLSPVPCVPLARETVAPVAVPRRVPPAGDPDLAHRDVTPQESSLGHARDLVPAVPTPTWGSWQGHPGATHLLDWGQAEGLGASSSLPPELPPEPCHRGCCRLPAPSHISLPCLRHPPRPPRPEG